MHLFLANEECNGITTVAAFLALRESKDEQPNHNGEDENKLTNHRQYRI